MFSRANKVPNEINKWIVKIIVKNSHIGIWQKTELMSKNMTSSQNVQNLKTNQKNDPMNAKNAEITNYGIMRIFNEVT